MYETLKCFLQILLLGHPISVALSSLPLYSMYTHFEDFAIDGKTADVIVIRNISADIVILIPENMTSYQGVQNT